MLKHSTEKISLQNVLNKFIFFRQKLKSNYLAQYSREHLRENENYRFTNLENAKQKHPITFLTVQQFFSDNNVRVSILLMTLSLPWSIFKTSDQIISSNYHQKLKNAFIFEKKGTLFLKKHLGILWFCWKRVLWLNIDLNNCATILSSASLMWQLCAFKIQNWSDFWEHNNLDFSR